MPTSSESAGVVPTMAAEQRREADVARIVGVDASEDVGVGVRDVGPDGEEAAEGEQSQDVMHTAGEGVVLDSAISDSPAPPQPTSTTTTWLTPWSWYYFDKTRTRIPSRRQ